MSQVEQEIQSLKEKLLYYQHEYYITGRPVVSDMEYDRLFDMLLELEEKHPELKSGDSPTQRVGSDLASDLPEVAHTIPVLSLDKAYSNGDVLDWTRKTEKNAGKSLSFVLEEKIDGISIVLYYEKGVLEKAVTRGNGQVGNDVTANVKTIGSVPLKLKDPLNIAVRGEIYLPKGLFENINKEMEIPYANPRNLAAGTIRRVKSSQVARIPLSIFIYEGFFDADSPFANHMETLDYLKEQGFRLNPRTAAFHHGAPDNSRGLRNFDDLEEYINKSTEQRASLDYEIDGLVLKVNEFEARERLGYTGHHPRWAIAYKFESPQGETVVKDIDVQVGRTGRITPVARVEGVNVGGATISNVTLHNQSYIDMLELSIGDRVSISRRGDVIPAVEKVLEKNDDGAPLYRLPAQCPVCGTPLEEKGAHTFCPNRNCPDQTRGRLRFFTGTDQMDIRNLGPETLEVLLERGLVRDIADLYTCDYDKLMDLQGFGEKKINLIRQGLAESKKRPFQRVLSSLGIPDLGPKVAELLVEGGLETMGAILKLAEEDDWPTLEHIPGIGEKTAKSLLEELRNPALRAQIELLASQGLAMMAVKEEKGDFPQIFSGQSWCITGSFEHFQPRSLAAEKIKERGGRIVSSVSSKTTHLLAGEKAGSKINKASELGVMIVSEDEFLKLLEG